MTSTGSREFVGEPKSLPQRSASTIAALIRARAEDDNVGLLYGERSWTWRQIVAESAVRAAWLRSTRGSAATAACGASATRNASRRGPSRARRR